MDETLPLSYVPSGKVMFQQYCATCHGADVKGNGPLASLLRTPPANLTTLSRRHAGKLPYEYVSSVLQFGPGPSAHGPSDMTAWGPIFRYYDKQNDRVVRQRIKNLSNHLASVQGKSHADSALRETDQITPEINPETGEIIHLYTIEMSVSVTEG